MVFLPSAQQMERLRKMFIFDTPREYAREYEVAIKSDVASLVQAFDLPFITDSVNTTISMECGAADPIISVMNLNLIDAETLSWEHILDLKNDTASCRKLQRLRTFIRDDYEGKSKSYIEDDVLLRLADYEETAQEWGMKLVKSSFQVVVDSKSLLAAASSSLAAAVLGQPLVSLVAMGGGVAIELGHIAIEIISGCAEYKRQLANHPLAYIVEARSKVND